MLRVVSEDASGLVECAPSAPSRSRSSPRAVRSSKPDGTKNRTGWRGLSSNSMHRTVNATHASLLAGKTDSAFSSQAIRAVVRAARNGTVLTLR